MFLNKQRWNEKKNTICTSDHTSDTLQFFFFFDPCRISFLILSVCGENGEKCNNIPELAKKNCFFPPFRRMQPIYSNVKTRFSVAICFQFCHRERKELDVKKKTLILLYLFGVVTTQRVSKSAWALWRRAYRCDRAIRRENPTPSRRSHGAAKRRSAVH